MLLKTTLFGFGGLSIALFIILSDNQAIFIQSRESTTQTGGPVFNRIQWINGPEKDIWMMNQAHHGAHASAAAWERLAIVIDKTQTPKTARFYQFEPGELKWSENLPEVPFRVSCFICHNNGPRLIRPQDPDLKTRIKIFWWNLRILSYGRVVEAKEHQKRDVFLNPPFRWRNAFSNQTLQVKTCLKCHRETGFFARGELKRQQSNSIRFMLQNELMPPPGFSLNPEEKKEMQNFLQGL